jgi:SAM-dependent methyltransferase
MSENISQEQVFVKAEADAWYGRGGSKNIKPAPLEHPVIKSLVDIGMSKKGRILDLGGGNGWVSAGILEAYSDWSAHVVEPSRKAVDHGKQLFGNISFTKGSISDFSDMPSGEFDLVLVLGVMCWIDRRYLSQSIANIDLKLADGGMLVLTDFYSPFNRSNKYKHFDGIKTFKQDYSETLKSLGIYTEIFRRQKESFSTGYKSEDPYDRWSSLVVLRKDLSSRYAAY